MTKNKIIKTSIFLMLILLPILDILRGTFIKDIEIANIALIELGNILFLFVALVFTFFKIDKKKFIKLFLYLLIVGIYIFLHYQNILKFDINIFPKATFNFVTESYYIFRVYLLPVFLLFILYENKDIFDQKFYFKVLKIIIGFISFSIIILNILKLSFISYSPEDTFITHNIFDHWTCTNCDYKLLSSRGWFDSANEISAIMFTLLPLNIFMLYKEKKKSNVFLTLGQVFAMILLGTRTAAFGSLLILGCSLIVYLLIHFIKKIKLDMTFFKKYLLVCICTGIFFCLSPFMQYLLHTEEATFEIENQGAYDILEEEELDEEEMSEIILKYKSEYKINEEFLLLYPVEDDIEFWFEMAKRDKALNNDSRLMKIDIIKRIKERNNNIADTYFGMGYTLNFLDLERDYIYQYYLFGIVGVVILIGIYFAIYMKNIIAFFKNIKNLFRFDVFLSFLAPALCFVIAYYSGHVFGWVSPMMMLSMSLGLLSYQLDKK